MWNKGNLFSRVNKLWPSHFGAGSQQSCPSLWSLMPHSYTTGLRCRKKIGVDIFLEPLKIISIRKTLSRECVPQRGGSWEKTVHMVLWENSIHVKKMWMVFLNSRGVPSASSKCFVVRNHLMKLLRTFPIVVSVEEREACNIAPVWKRLKSWKQAVPNETSKTALNSVKARERGFGGSWPNVATVFHLWADLTFVEIENSSWG